jgi:hypothetical protein
MNYLEQPYFRKEENVYVLYKLNFSTDSNYSPHTSVASGNGIEVGRFSSEEEMQKKSIELFKQRAKQATN